MYGSKYMYLDLHVAVVNVFSSGYENLLQEYTYYITSFSST